MTKIDQIKRMFVNQNLLKQALTHRSWINEHPRQRGTNERLEFLGDAILEFIVSEELYRRFPHKEEGYLTTLRANLVNTLNLAAVAQKLSLGQNIYLAKGEEESGGRANLSLLADTVEAIIGALYLDQGLNKTKEFIQVNIINSLDKKIKGPLKDAKSRLQEYVQAQGKSIPNYMIIDERGPDHAKDFVIEVLIDNKPWGRGKGKSKAEAEQKAAQKALGAYCNLIEK